MIHPLRVKAIGTNTFREAIRNRAFLGLMLFAVSFILASLLLSELTVAGQGARVVTDFGFFAVGLFGAVTAIVMGALLLYKEVEKKTIYTIVSKPIRRSEFILGKYLGLLGILTAAVVGLAAVWAGVLASQGGQPGLEHVKGMALVLLEVSLVASVAVMFSAASNPTFTGLLTFGVFLVGRLVYLVEEMLTQSKGLFVENPVARVVGEAAVAVFPDLSVFNASQQVLLGVPIAWSYVGHAALYAASYVAIFIVIGLLAFERRDFV